jgi:hypothetical protein
MARNWLRSVILVLPWPVAGLWFWLGFEDRTQMLAALALASIAVVGAFWYFRVQNERHWRTVMDAYAERALAQDQSYQRPKAGEPEGQRRSQLAAEQRRDSYRFRTKEGDPHARTQP